MGENSWKLRIAQEILIKYAPLNENNRHLHGYIS